MDFFTKELKAAQTVDEEQRSLSLEEKMANYRDLLLLKTRCNREQMLVEELKLMKLHQEMMMDIIKPIVEGQENSTLKKKFEIYETLFQQLENNFKYATLQSQESTKKRMLIFVILVCVFFGIFMLPAAFGY